MTPEQIINAINNPKTIYTPPKFDREIAQQVEQELKADYPDNKWSDNYLVHIIQLCCNGDEYFYGHHDAFRRYLRKLNLYNNFCCNCELTFFTAEVEEFCSELCVVEYFS